ncbi:hypothetical protein NHG34_03115 [Aerococcaceae bacterium NML190938]|nr:hypothetical protein [Aerococcaceae bacterium NML190938]
MAEFNVELMLVEATKLPMVKIDREKFLRTELGSRYDKNTVNLAIEYSPAYAGIRVEDIDNIAKSCIVAETRNVTTISTLAGMPGGFAAIGTITADVIQYFAHILRILQKLIYLYGWSDLNLDSENMNEETKNRLIIFLGVMFGANQATKAISKLSPIVAEQIVKKLPQKALTKGVIYPIVKKISAFLGVKMTKEIFAKNVAKIVPILGGIVSGGITYITFSPMAHNLRRYLSTLELANVDYIRSKKSSDQEIIDVEFIED